MSEIDYSEFKTAYDIESPGQEWYDITEALDCPDSGNARRHSLEGDRWTQYLIWIFEPFTANVVELRFYVPTPTWEYEVDLFDGNEWLPVRHAYENNDTNPLTVEIPPTRIEKVRLRVKHYSDDERYADAFCCWLGFICLGPLAPICAIFHNIGDWLEDLADDIEPISLVGDALAAPFRFLSEKFHDLGTTCCEVSGELQEVLNSLGATLSWETVLALLAEHAPVLYYLLLDPLGELLYLIGQLFNLTPYQAQTPETVVKALLEKHFPALYEFWLDPRGWLADQLEEHFPIIYYLALDPLGELLYLAAQIFGLSPYEAQTGEFVVKALFERYFPELYQLWLDPDSWLEEHVNPIILAALGGIVDFLSDPWGWLLNQLEETLEMYAIRIGEIALKIVANLLGE